jgi:hypothetical protein
VITKAERTELRSVVRQQFKVLRSEIEQRRAELEADLDVQIRERFAKTDEQWAVVMHQIHEAVMEANRAVNDALYNAGYQIKSGTERLWIQSPGISQPTQDRQELRRAARGRIEAEVKAAYHKLDRDEADLLRTLAVGAIESEEAREFLSRIPSVGELVSRTRLAELEASLTDDGGMS